MSRSFNGVLLRKIGPAKVRQLLDAGQLECGVCVPAYRGDEEWLREKKEQALIVAEDKTPPNAKLRRLYWAILGKVCQNHWYYEDRDELNEHIKTELRYFKYFTDHNLNYKAILKSNSDIEGNWEEFKEYFDRAMVYLTTTILPGMSSAALIREVEEMMGGPTYKDAMRGNRGHDTGELYGDAA